MARVKAYIGDKEVYNEECEHFRVDEYIIDALNSWSNIEDIDNVVVEVTDNDGSVWSPV